MTTPADPQPTVAKYPAEHELRTLFGPSVTVFSTLTGPAHLVKTANSAFLEATGAPTPHTGVPLAELVPALATAGVIAALDDAYRTGSAQSATDVPLLLGAPAREAWFDFGFEPRRDAAGAVTGIQLIGVETTQVKHAQRLLAEQRALVEQIARQAPLTEVLDGMARSIESLSPQQVLVSVLLADPDGRHLRHGAAPSLPEFYNEAIDGIATGEGVGSCGTAAHRRAPVVVTDIGVDPFWDDFRELAVRAGLAACWSTPILARDGGLLGTFAMYHREPRVPGDSDLAMAAIFAETAALAIERHHIEQAQAAAEAQAAAARDELARALRVEHELRAEAEQRAEAAAELAARIRAAASAQAEAPHPEQCRLGGPEGCTARAEIKIADSWGDSAWGCPDHVEEAILNVRSVFIASEELGGLAAYVNR
ncbi:GAF domain-containing protein [Nocardia sp. NPDC048505]|uniref:GAF domain-containing protein n=1 Tax=unclassified Nocardia TaxID=2637762 RepID=UPI0034028BED